MKTKTKLKRKNNWKTKTKTKKYIKTKITLRQNHGGWHYHSPVSPTEDSLTHTTRQSSSWVLGGLPVP